MRYFFILLGLVCLLSGTVRTASADLVWTITPEVRVQQEYTDNLFLDRDDRKSDWITVVGVGAELEARGRTGGMTLGYRPSYSMYYDNDEFDTLRHNADLELWKDLRKDLRWSLSNSFERREYTQDLSRYIEIEEEVLIDPEEILRRGLEPRSVNYARTRLDYQFGPRDRAYAQYGLRHEWNDNPGEEDSVIHMPRAGMTYWFSRLYGLEVAAGYTHGRYDESENVNNWDGRTRLMRNFTRHLDGYLQYRHSHVRYSGDRSGYTLYEPSTGISYRFARDGRLDVGLGYYYRDEEDNGSDDGVVFNTDIYKTWDQRRSSLTLRGGSGATQTFLGTDAQGFTIYYRGGAVYSYALRRDLDWDISADYRRSIYKDRAPERRDSFYRAGTGLSYMWTRSVSVGVNYDHRRVDSNIRAQEYYENRGTLSITWRPRPKRLN